MDISLAVIVLNPSPWVEGYCNAVVCLSVYLSQPLLVTPDFAVKTKDATDSKRLLMYRNDGSTHKEKLFAGTHN